MELVTVDLHRTLRVPVETARHALQEALEALDLRIESAERNGSDVVRGSVVVPGAGPQVPWVNLAVRVSELPRRGGRRGATQVHIRLADADPRDLPPSVAFATYGPLFSEVQQHVDRRLQQLDRSLVIGPLPPLVVRSRHPWPQQTALAAGPQRAALGPGPAAPPVAAPPAPGPPIAAPAALADPAEDGWGEDDWASDPSVPSEPEVVSGSIVSPPYADEPTEAAVAVPVPARLASGHLPAVVSSAASVPATRSSALAAPPKLSVWLVTPNAFAVLEHDQVQLCLAVAAVIATGPPVLPPPLERHLGDVAIALWHCTLDARPPAARLDIAEQDKKVLNFLLHQGMIRTSLPLREVHKCRRCRSNHLVDPTPTGSDAGRGSRISPFLARARMLDDGLFEGPPAPCPRCGSSDMEPAIATFCPRCRTVTTQTVLWKCSQRDCGYDYRSRVVGGSGRWQGRQATAGRPRGRPRGRPGRAGAAR